MLEKQKEPVSNRALRRRQEQIKLSVQGSLGNAYDDVSLYILGIWGLSQLWFSAEEAEIWTGQCL